MKKGRGKVSLIVALAVICPLFFFQNCASQVDFAKDSDPLLAKVPGVSTLASECSFESAPESLNRERETTLKVRFKNTGDITWQPSEAPEMKYASGTNILVAVKIPNTIYPGETWDRTLAVKEHMASPPGSKVNLVWTLDHPSIGQIGRCEKSFTVSGTVDFDSVFESTDLASPVVRKNAQRAAFRFRNTGLKTWKAGEITLKVQSDFTTVMPLPSDVEPNASVSITAEVRAPDAAGPVKVTAQLQGAAGLFGSKYESEVLIDDSIASPVDGAGPKLSGNLLENQQYNTTVTLVNNGSSIWTPGNYVLTEAEGRNYWSLGELAVRQNVRMGESHQFPVRVTAPRVTAGTCSNYMLKVQMRNKVRNHVFGAGVTFRSDVMDPQGNITVCGQPVGDFTYGPWGPLELFSAGGQTFGRQSRTQSCSFTGGCRNPQPTTQYVASWAPTFGTCDRSCGGGTQSVSAAPLTWTFTANGAPKPADSQACNTQRCNRPPVVSMVRQPETPGEVLFNCVDPDQDPVDSQTNMNTDEENFSGQCQSFGHGETDLGNPWTTEFSWMIRPHVNQGDCFAEVWCRDSFGAESGRIRWNVHW